MTEQTPAERVAEARAKLSIGQIVQLYAPYRRAPDRGEITKIGRSLVTIKDGPWREDQYLILTGRQKGEHSGGAYFLTEEMAAVRERKKIAWAALNELGLTHAGYGRSDIPVDKIEAVVEVLRS